MKIKLITIPNLLTLANLFCGSLATVAALVWGDFATAFWLIVAAVVFDFFDGFVARLLNQSSPLGVELDSLADMITSGLAPAAVLFALYAQSGGGEALDPKVLTFCHYALFIATACAALRLARFNIDDTQHTEFRGLPTPAYALFCGSIGLLASTGDINMGRIAIFVIAVVMALLMVSPIRMIAFKFKGFGWRGNELRYSFVVATVVLVAFLQLKAVPVVILLYIVVSTVNWIWTLITAAKEESKA